MGITIHYRGRLRDPAQLPQLTTELQADCARLGWPCQTVDERILGVGERYECVPIETDDGIPTSRVEIVEEGLDDDWRGVVIQPPGCETLHLTFDRRGVLVHYGNALESPLTPGRYSIERQLAVKTQFGLPEAHVGVCDLLRRVERVSAEWEVNDEGGYWETGDYQVLLARRARMESLMNALSDPEAMQAMLKEAGLDMEVSEPPEVGKTIHDVSPPWRRGWGVSAGKN